MRNLFYYNSTGRSVRIHPGTDEKVRFKNNGPIEHGKTVMFSYPEKFSPFIKVWGDKKHGLQIIILLIDERKPLKTKKSKDLQVVEFEKLED